MRAVQEIPFFDQLGITNVVWLDDLFDAKVEANEIDITEQVAAAITAGTQLSHPKLQDLTTDDSPQEWTRRILERLDASERKTFLEQISPVPAPSTPSDYTPD